MKCEVCKGAIDLSDLLRCTLCKTRAFHFSCLNIKTSTFMYKNTWQCESCANNKRKNHEKKCDDKTPKGGVQDKSKTLSNIDTDEQNVNESSVLVEAEASLATEIRLLREEMHAARAEMQEFRNTISSLTSAVTKCNSRIDELSMRVEVVENRQREPPSDNGIAELERVVADLKLELNDRDQEMLVNDLEIAGIPEEKNERPVHLFICLAAKLGVTLEERDVVSVERAGMLRKTEPGNAARLRPFVVRLARRALRDDLLAAARVRRSVSTAGLGLAASGEQRIYLNERLTRSNRHIFFRARSVSVQANWKYVWTRDGKIYARKEHGAARHRLRSEADIPKVFGHT